MSVSEHPLTRISRLARPHTGRLLLGVVLGALAIAAGIGLMATAGLPHLAGRSAPADPRARRRDRRRALLRRLARRAALPRAASSRTTPRCARSRPCACGCSRGSSRSFPPGCPACARATSSARFVADVDALQNLYLRAFGPAAVALLAGGLAVAVALVALPAAGLVLARLPRCSRASSCRSRAWRSRARAVRREAPARAALTAELLDALAAAPGARRLRRRRRGGRARRCRRRRPRAGAPAHRARRRRAPSRPSPC